MSATAQFEAGGIVLLGGLLAAPAALRKHLIEYSAARSAALASEERRGAAESDFADHQEVVTDKLASLEKQVAARRERVEGLEGVNEAQRATLADSEWAGLRMPSEVAAHG